MHKLNTNKVKQRGLEKFQPNASTKCTKTSAKMSTCANNANIYTNYYVISTGYLGESPAGGTSPEKLCSFGQISAMSLATRRIRNHFPFDH